MQSVFCLCSSVAILICLMAGQRSRRRRGDHRLRDRARAGGARRGVHDRRRSPGGRRRDARVGGDAGAVRRSARARTAVRPRHPQPRALRQLDRRRCARESGIDVEYRPHRHARSRPRCRARGEPETGVAGAWSCRRLVAGARRGATAPIRRSAPSAGALFTPIHGYVVGPAARGGAGRLRRTPWRDARARARRAHRARRDRPSRFTRLPARSTRAASCSRPVRGPTRLPASARRRCGRCAASCCTSAGAGVRSRRSSGDPSVTSSPGRTARCSSARRWKRSASTSASTAVWRSRSARSGVRAAAGRMGRDVRGGARRPSPCHARPAAGARRGSRGARRDPRVRALSQRRAAGADHRVADRRSSRTRKKRPGPGRLPAGSLLAVGQ